MGGNGDEPPKLELPRAFCPTFSDGPPKIETRSSRGLVDVPEIMLAAAGRENISVAAKPDGCPFVAGSSSKSRRFSACWPAATVCRAFCAESRSSPLKVLR
jgi:hypothetical protein